MNWLPVTTYDRVTPKEPGCYAIYKMNIQTMKKELLYIGTARNLYTRLNKHEVKKVMFAVLKYPDIVYVKVKIMPNKQTRLAIEKKLIERLKPPINYA